ncbi:hypothetical protein BKA70DRAFT_1283124 [Coprinopsis sp. MPI-PUGE-AT-0042]|nr:hypothetical protein BKA70DRAFT_1283124 [Coprinopsis sp. MPI-PUGE-AT-0042]
MSGYEESAARVLLTVYYTVVPISFAAIGMQLVMCGFGQTVYGESSMEERKDRRMYIICTSDALARVKPQIAKEWWRQWVTGICLSLCNFIGDGLLVWRCYNVWAEHRWISIVPCATYLAQIALCIVSGVFLHLRNKTPATQLAYVQTLQAWIFLSVAVNCMVTGLISWRLFRIRKDLAGILSREDLRIYLGVVAILVESALPLALSGIVFAAFSGVSSTPRNRAGRNIALLLWFTFNALSPQMIIFRVTTGRSWVGRPSPLGPRRTRVGEVSTGINFSHESHPERSEVAPGDGRREERDGSETVINIQRRSDA